MSAVQNALLAASLSGNAAAAIVEWRRRRPAAEPGELVDEEPVAVALAAPELRVKRLTAAHDFMDGETLYRRGQEIALDDPVVKRHPQHIVTHI